MSKVNQEDKPLKIKEKAVLNNYFLHFNGTRAWMEVHPKSSYDAARSNVQTEGASPISPLSKSKGLTNGATD